MIDYCLTSKNQYVVAVIVW